MANAFVRGITNSSASASSLATTITAPTNGNELIVIVAGKPSAGNNARTVSSITCTNVTGFAQLNSLTEATFHTGLEIWSGSVGASAGNSLTVNMSAAAAPLLIVIWEFSGGATSTDVAFTGSSGSSVTPSTGTYSSPTAGDLVIVAAAWSSTIAATGHPTGFTAPVSGKVAYTGAGANLELEVDYLLSGSSGAQSAATWTISSSAWLATGVGLKVPAAAASPVFRRTLSGLGTRTGARQGSA